MRSIIGLTLVTCLAMSVPAAGQTAFPVTISGTRAEVRVELPGGVAADLTITFESVVGLHATALEVTASTIDPATLISRLPGGAAAGVPTAFPVLIRVEPRSSSGLSFQGIATISVHTHNLTLQRQPPLGLYSAPSGEAFREITTSTGIGSYRAGGSTGGFSEFLIAVDARPIDTGILGKLDALQAILSGHAEAIAAPVLANLQNRFGQIQALYGAGALQPAIAEVSGFANAVKASSGSAIPDVWRAHDTRVNVAGQLRAAAETLRYSLTLKASGTP